MGKEEGNEFRQGGAPESDRGSSAPTAEDPGISCFGQRGDEALWAAHRLLSDGDVAGAERNCDIAFQLKSERCPAALTCRGLTRRALGRHREAEDDFRRAKDLSPDNVSTVAAYAREAIEQIIREQKWAFQLADWTSTTRSDQAIDRRPPSRYSRTPEHAPSLISQMFETKAEFESPPIFLTAPKSKGSVAQNVQADLHFKGSLTAVSPDQVTFTLTLDGAKFGVHQCLVNKDAVGYFPFEIEITASPAGWGPDVKLHKVRPGDELHSQLGERTGTTGWTAGIILNVPSLSAGARFSGTQSMSTMHPIIAHHFLPASMDLATKAVQFGWKMDTWANGEKFDPSSAYRTMPMPPFDKPGHINFPDLGDKFEGVWMVPRSTSEVLQNKFAFNITVRVHLAAAMRTTLALGLGTRYQVFRLSPFIELFNVVSVQA